MISGVGDDDPAPATIAPPSPNAHLYLEKAQRAQARGDIAKARRHYTRATEYFPSEADAFYLLAQLETADRNFELAVDLLTTALGIQPNHPGFLYLLGYALFALGRPFEAAPLLEKTVKIDPDDQLAKVLLANVYRRSDRHDRGSDCLAAVDIGKISIPEELVMLSVVLRDYRLYERARHILGDLIDRNLLVPAALYELTQFPELRLSADHRKRIGELLAQSSIDPHHRCLLEFAAGKIADSEERYDEAFAHFISANSLYVSTHRLPDPPFDLDRYDDSIRRMTGVFGPEFAAVTRDHGVRSQIPVFVVGMPRSGKSLVESVIAHHPSIAGAGEIEMDGFVGRDLLMKPDGSLSPGFEQRVSELAPGSTRELAQKYLDHMARFGAARVVNTTPSNFNNVGVIKLLWPDARIINVRRDPRDTCFFCYSAHFDQAHGYTNDLRILARYHRRYLRIMEHWSTVYADDVINVSYEDFVEHTPEMIVKVCDFLGLAAAGGASADEQRPATGADLEFEGRAIERTYIGRARHYAPHMAEVLGEFDWPEPAG